MELVDGRNLTDLLPREGFPLERTLEIAIPLADAVSTAHRAGITHRDLKPDNVMFDAQGRLRVLDFGLAKLHDPTTKTQDAQTATVTSDTAEGRVLGTVAYMSPEQAEGREVDARSDVFSLGTILYEMTTGKRPFHGETTMSTISSILKDEPSSITDVKPGLPRHAGRILRRCLAKDPERRYQTAIDVRNELEELEAEIGSGEHKVAVEEPVFRRLSRVPILVVAAVGIVVGAVAMRTLWMDDEPGRVEYVQQPVTASLAADQETSWSPDGKSIAFSRVDSGNVDIYIKSIDSGTEVGRITGAGDQVAPRWSPDGRLLAYVTPDPGSPVWVVPPDGGTPSRVIDTNAGALTGDPQDVIGVRPWSDDSKTLLVSRSVDRGPFSIYRVERETGEAVRLTDPPLGSNDTMATYSFDYEQILFRRGQVGALVSESMMMMMPVRGGEPELLHLATGVNALLWRPDNRTVVYNTDNMLYEIDVATRRTRQLVSATKAVWGVSISHDDRLIYTDFWHYQFLFEVDVETGTRRQITRHAQNNVGARFSPDGRTIAYSSNRTGNLEIWLNHLDGRPETRLTDNDANDFLLDWSPDGKRLVFKSGSDDGGQRLFVITTDGAGGARQLVDQGTSGRLGPAFAQRPRWSPDGELIAYGAVGEKEWELWTVGPDGSGARKRLDGVREFDWYLDSRRALITRPQGSETQLFAVDLESGEERVLFVGALQEIDVAPDGSGVAFCYGRGHYSMGLAVLKLEPGDDADGLPVAVGEPEYVVSTEGSWHVHNGGWSPDSKRIVYMHDQDYGDIYELVEER